MRTPAFILMAVAAAALTFGATRAFDNEYAFFAGYTVLQFVVLATAWNILGGYTGYVNFGSAAFFALGAYTSVALHKFDPQTATLPLGIDLPSIGIAFDFGEIPLGFLAPLFPLPIPALVGFAAVVGGLVGFGTGYLTLRLRGAFFAIATLALAVVLQTLVTNWSYVGGSRGAYVIRPQELQVGSFHLPYIQYLFGIMLGLAVVAVVAARCIERSKLGLGFTAIRDDEVAAEASGVPTLRLKLIATTLSGALMGMAGAPFPYYIGYLQPASAFALEYAVNAIAMPMIGGPTSWIGPLIGAIMLGTLQQIATVTISSAVNLLIVGVLLVGSVIIAPNGIVGLIFGFIRAATHADRMTSRATWVTLIVIAVSLFVSGILQIVFALAVLAKPDMHASISGWMGLGFAAYQVTAAYGLIKIRAWAPAVGIAPLGISVLILVLDLVAGDSGNAVLQVAGLVCCVTGCGVLLSPPVRRLYDGPSPAPPAPEPRAAA